MRLDKVTYGEMDRGMGKGIDGWIDGWMYRKKTESNTTGKTCETKEKLVSMDTLILYCIFPQEVIQSGITCVASCASFSRLIFLLPSLYIVF
jgi:hypothetical protein